MKYIEDERYYYKDQLIKQLREYNIKHTGEKESYSQYFYAFDNDKLVGAVYINFSWDWAGLGSIFYDNIEVLKKIISEVCNHYRDKAVGLKLYSEVESRVDDFKYIGFSIGGKTENTPKTTQYFYLKHTKFDIHSEVKMNVINSDEKIEMYDAVLLNHLEKFDKENDIHDVEEANYMFVALDDNKFAGGVHGSVTEDSMYIGWLVVDEAYRGNEIGKNLMYKIEAKAKELNIYSINLGTVEFQAKEFYSKLGYKTVFIKENDPRGYKSYSLIKKI
jgi:GNAT superfamily N-acetyltransferase